MALRDAAASADLALNTADGLGCLAEAVAEWVLREDSRIVPSPSRSCVTITRSRVREPLAPVKGADAARRVPHNRQASLGDLIRNGAVENRESNDLRAKVIGLQNDPYFEAFAKGKSEIAAPLKPSLAASGLRPVSMRMAQCTGTERQRPLVPPGFPARSARPVVVYTSNLHLQTRGRVWSTAL